MKHRPVISNTIRWRCFHCGDAFTESQRKHAESHFGRNCTTTPVCLIRTAGEFALLEALRDAEKQLESYRAEDNRILVAMHHMQADHDRAVKSAEQKGFDMGVVDARKYEFREASTISRQPIPIPECLNLRGTGRTTNQIENAPLGSAFVITYGLDVHLCDIIRSLNRFDLSLYTLQQVDQGDLRGVCKSVVVDHEAWRVATAEQKAILRSFQNMGQIKAQDELLEPKGAPYV